MTPLKRLAIPAMVVIASGCGESLGPTDYVGSYMLRTVNAASLPSTVAAQPAGCTWEFAHGSLILGDGAFTLFLHGTTGCPGQTYMSGVPGMMGGGLSTSGEAIELIAVDPTSPSAVTMRMTAHLDGFHVRVRFPAGAMHLGESAEMVFGPRQTTP